MNASFLALVTLFAAASCLAAQPDGAALYRDNCSQCHGEHGKGGTVGMGAMMQGSGGMMNGSGSMPGNGSGAMGMKAPKLAGDASKWPPKLFERAVLTGVDDEGKALNGVMPHWGSASFASDHGKAPTKAEVDAIQRYLQAQK